MRIIAGVYKSRRLSVPPGPDIRPTSDKVRGAIFNALGSRMVIEGTHVLDAFCGSGALGLEALSRGAASALFIDSARKSLDCAKGNAAALGTDDACTFLQKDVLKLGDLPAAQNPFDLVFLDPPYRQNLAPAALHALIDGGWFAPQAIIVVETETTTPLSWPPICTLLDEKTYGETKISFLQKK